MFSCLSFVLGGVMALSCMKYLHSVSDIFLWEPGGFFGQQFYWSEFVNVAYPNLGEKNNISLGHFFFWWTEEYSEMMVDNPS